MTSTIEESVFLYVHQERLNDAGIHVDATRKYVKDLLEAVGEMMAEAVLDFVGQDRRPAHTPSTKQEAPAWLQTVFPEGIPLEIVTVRRDGSRKIEKMTLPVR